MVRAGKRLADALDADWTVVYVETPELLRLAESERNRRIDLLRLAESLGAETVTLDGPTAAEVLLEYAHTRKATRVARRGAQAARLARLAAALDDDRAGSPGAPVRRHDDRRVGRMRRRGPRTGRRRRSQRRSVIRWDRYRLGAAVDRDLHRRRVRDVPRFELANLVMVYLLGATIAGLRLGRVPAVVSAVANVAAFDFFFVPPRFTFAVSRRAVPGHVRRHADRDARDRDPDGERAPADARRRRARAAHRAALRDEPRAGRDARRREHGAGRRQACRRGVRMRGRRVAA